MVRLLNIARKHHTKVPEKHNAPEKAGENDFDKKKKNKHHPPHPQPHTEIIEQDGVASLACVRALALP
jgi:hypothetical protein